MGIWLSLSLIFGLQLAHANSNFPLGPDPRLTPGTLCERPSEYRYAEKIKYCIRNVDEGTKLEVRRRYDKELGYHVQQMPRREFKTDHYIPLCMGGSNEASNLWPQHETVYVITDPMEHLSCELMKAGRLRQERAIQYIREGKANLSRVPAILRELQSLR